MLLRRRCWSICLRTLVPCLCIFSSGSKGPDVAFRGPIERQTWVHRRHRRPPSIALTASPAHLPSWSGPYPSSNLCSIDVFPGGFFVLRQYLALDVVGVKHNAHGDDPPAWCYIDLSPPPPNSRLTTASRFSTSYYVTRPF